MVRILIISVKLVNDSQYIILLLRIYGTQNHNGLFLINHITRTLITRCIFYRVPLLTGINMCLQNLQKKTCIQIGAYNNNNARQIAYQSDYPMQDKNAYFLDISLQMQYLYKLNVYNLF